MEHHRVVAQWRAGVYHRVERRLVADRGLVHPAGYAGHLDRVDVALSAEAVNERDLVRQGEHVVGGVQVADRRVEVHGFHRVAGDRVYRVQDLAHLEQVPVVLTVAVATVATQAGHERWAGDARVGDDVVADVQVPGRVGCVEGEARRCRCDQRHDQLGVEPHPVPVHVASGVGQLAECGFVQEVDAGLGEYPQRCTVDCIQLVLGYGAQRVEPHAGLAPRGLCCDRVPFLGSAAQPSPARLAHGQPPIGLVLVPLSGPTVRPTVPLASSGRFTGPPRTASERPRESGGVHPPRTGAPWPPPRSGPRRGPAGWTG